MMILYISFGLFIKEINIYNICFMINIINIVNQNITPKYFNLPTHHIDKRKILFNHLNKAYQFIKQFNQSFLIFDSFFKKKYLL